MKFKKIYFLAIIFIFLSGCIKSTALLGPGVTLATTGNVFQAGMQYGANTAIKKETGKDALSHIKDAVENNSKKKKFEKKFINLVEKRFNTTRQKLSLN